jgi:hypothetical protein
LRDGNTPFTHAEGAAVTLGRETEKRRENMPQIIVTADRGEGAVTTWRERINASDFESAHFAHQLVERIGWAVSDAHEVEEHADRRPLSSENVQQTEAPADPAPEAPAETTTREPVAAG